MARYTPRELQTGTRIHCLRDAYYKHWEGTVTEVKEDFATVQKQDGAICYVRVTAIGKSYEGQGEPIFLNDAAHQDYLANRAPGTNTKNDG